MELTRDHFEPDMLAVLDQVAMLIFINKELRRMGATFENSPSLDKELAEPDATYILKFTRETSMALMGALCWKKAKKMNLLAIAYKNAIIGVDKSIENAKKLATQEAAADATIIRKYVLANLMLLRDVWTPVH